MPGKSEYIEAPFTVDRLTQAMKDAFEFVGYNVTQTQDSDQAFDSEYWRAKQTTSTKNLLPESEQLTQNYIDFPEFGGSFNGSNPYGPGSEMYIKENTDPAYPFKLINVHEPRQGSKNSHFYWKVGGLSKSSDYTVSFWAKKTSGNSQSGVMSISAGMSTSSPYTYAQSLSLGALSGEFQRYSFTFNTAQNTDLVFYLGGNSSWTDYPITDRNRLRYTESFNYWPSRGVSMQQINENVPAGGGYTFGYTYIWRLNFSTHPERAVAYYQADTGGPALDGKTYTYSIYAKVLSGAPSISFGGGSQEVVLDTIGEWKRYSVTGVVAAGTGRYSNCHVWGATGDSVMVWGAQFEEGSVATPYLGNEAYFVTTPSKMHGGIEYGGFQLEKSSTATTYAPVRTWHFKPYPGGPKSISMTLQNQLTQLYYTRPGGVDYSFISCSSSKKYEGKIVPVANINQSENTNYSYSAFRQEGLPFRLTEGLSDQGGAVKDYQGSSYNLENNISTAIRVIIGKNPNNSRNKSYFGNIYYNILPESTTRVYNGTNSSEFKKLDVDLTIYGVVFKLSRPVDHPGSSSTRGYGFVQKTPGDGRKKFTSVFLKEVGDNVEVSVTTPLVAHQLSGIAELPGYMIPVLSPVVTYPLTTNRNTSPVDGYGAEHSGLTSPTEFLYKFTLVKNNDTFSFVQGAADGFIWALNVNSNFLFKYIQADLVNSPHALDNGSTYTRYAIGGERVDNDAGNIIGSINWHAHGPSVNSTYGIGFGDHYRMWADGSFYRAPTSRFHEVYGDAIDSDTFLDSIYQMYCVYNNEWVASTRGQLKNMHYIQSRRFSGMEGDSILAKDGTRYFAVTKTLGSTDVNNERTLTHLVKV